MSRHFFVTILFLFAVNLFSQSPYQKYSASDNILLGVTALAGFTTLYLEHHMAPLTAEQAAQLDRQSVNRFDRSATYLLSPRSAKLSDYGLRTSLLLPLGLLVDERIRKSSTHVGYLYFETMAVTGVATELTKVLTQRLRPWAFNDNVPLANKKGKEVKKAFFSGHTSVSFAGCVLFAKLYEDFYPDSEWRPYIWGGSLTIASAVGYWRYRAGRHYPTDVLVGALVGGLVAYYIPELHKKEKSNIVLQTNSAQPMMIGFQMSF
jgi:membrane-associated phospholipid phosphatase